MTMRMLIDARHREETRVAVVKGSRIEEFDFESAEHKQLKGNIYLAKVTRVEPSLQAAFIDYGGNRHGFLAFSEIHPDYYQIPKEDREALLREEAEHAAEEERLRAGDHDDDDGVDGDGRLHDRDMSDDEGFAADAAAGETDDSGDDDAPTPQASGNGVDEKAADSLREKRLNLRRRYKIQDVIRRRQVLLVQVVKEERGNKGAALTTYLSLAGRYCVLMPNTSHGGGISRKISNAADRKRLKSIMADLQLPRTMGCIVRTAGLQRTKIEIRRDFDYLARLWDEIRENTLKSAAPALVYQDSDLIKRAIRDIYNKDIDEVVVEGSEGFTQARQFMKLLMPSHVRRVRPYADTVPLFQSALVEDQLAAMYNPVVQLKSGGYLVINPTEALVSIDINSGRSTREYGIEATAVGTNLEAAHEIARQLRLRDMAGLVVIDFIDMENSSNIRKVEKAMKAALSDDRARIQVGRISSFGLMEMSRQRLRTGVLEASTRQCPHCEGTGLVRTASSAGLSALRMLEDEAGRGRGSQLVLTASREATLYVLNRKRRELGEIEARYGVAIEVMADNEDEGARMTVEASGPPPAFTPRIEAPPVFDDEDDDIVEEDFDEADDTIVAEPGDDAAPVRSGRADARPRDDADGDGGRRKRRRRGRRGRRDDGEAIETNATADADSGETDATGEHGENTGAGDSQVAARAAEAAAAIGDDERKPRRGRRGGRRRRGRGDAPLTAAGQAEDAAIAASYEVGDDDGSAPLSGESVKPADAVATPTALTETEAAAVTTVAAGATKPKRTRKPKVEAPAEATAAATGDQDALADAVPKPKRTRKAKPGEGDAQPDQAAVEPAPKARRSRKAALPAPLDSDAPVLPLEEAPDAGPDAAVTAAPGAPPATAAAPVASDDEPKRGGWWQRTFGTVAE